jgi:hypothetical protein
LGAGFLVAAALFVLAERRATEPIIPLRLFRNSIFTVAGLIGFGIGVCMFGALGYIPVFLQTVDGASATESGLLMLPFVAGMLLTSISSGRIIAATGRYKVFPVAGTVVAGVGLYLLSLMNADSSRVRNGLAMAVLGLGIGLVMQVLVLVVQNAAPRRDLGAATAAATYFRQIGASIGASVVGAVFTHRLTDLLPRHLPSGTVRVPDVSGLTPHLLAQLPAPVRSGVVAAIADALPPVFRYLVPLTAVAFVLALLLREIPLRTADTPASNGIAPERRDALVAGLVLTAAARRASPATADLVRPTAAALLSCAVAQQERVKREDT